MKPAAPALPTRERPGTGVVTCAVGFGCAGLFRIHQSGPDDWSWIPSMTLGYGMVSRMST
jgi:hypothetical protein